MRLLPAHYFVPSLPIGCGLGDALSGGDGRGGWVDFGIARCR